MQETLQKLRSNKIRIVLCKLFLPRFRDAKPAIIAVKSMSFIYIVSVNIRIYWSGSNTQKNQHRFSEAVIRLALLLFINQRNAGWKFSDSFINFCTFSAFALPSTNKSTKQLTLQLINQPKNRPNDRPTDQPTNQPTNRPTNQITNQPTNKQTNKHTNKQTNQLTNWRHGAETFLRRQTGHQLLKKFPAF